MVVTYRGFEVHVTRAKSRAGYKLIYFHVVRESDGFMLEDSYSDSADTVRTWVRMMKSRVDGFINDPSCEVLETEWLRGAKYAKEIARHRRENEKSQRGAA